MFKILIHVVFNSGKEEQFYFGDPIKEKKEAEKSCEEYMDAFVKFKYTWLEMKDSQGKVRSFRFDQIAMFSVKVLEPEARLGEY